MHVIMLILTQMAPHMFKDHSPNGLQKRLTEHLISKLQSYDADNNSYYGNNSAFISHANVLKLYSWGDIYSTAQIIT